MRRLLLTLAAAAALVGCTGKPPEIAEVRLTRLYMRGPEDVVVSPQLSLFLRASDPDGSDDLAVVYLIHEAQELYWQLEAGTWQSVRLGPRAEEWIGAHGLLGPGGDEPPAGSYRVLVQDFGGEIAERTVELGPAPRREFPRVDFSGGQLTVDRSGAEVWAMGGDGTLISTRTVEQLDLAFWQGVRSFYVVAADTSATVAIGPFYR